MYRFICKDEVPSGRTIRKDQREHELGDRIDLPQIRVLKLGVRANFDPHHLGEVRI